MTSHSHDSQVDAAQLAYWQQAARVQRQQRQVAAAIAWEQVQKIAACLKQEFGATQVMVFGSLVRDRFTEQSDLDIAVANLPSERYFEAVARVNELSDRWVDLKPLEVLDLHFQQRVLATGVIVDAID